MLEIINEIIKLILQFVTTMFNLPIEWREGMYVPIGVLACGFLVFVFVIYFVIKILIPKKDD